MRLKIQSYQLPFCRPFRSAHGVRRLREGLLLELRDSDGRCGLGEVAPLPGFGGESLEQAQAALKIMQPALESLSHPPASTSELHQRFLDFRALAPDAPATQAGLCFAMADLAAQRQGLPLARWLRSDAGAEVSVNATISADEPAAAAENALARQAEGFGTFKVKLSDDDALDLQRIGAIREALGAEARLRVDANASWETERALRMLDALSGLGIEYVEQPAPVTGDLDADVAALRSLRDSTEVSIAADELLLRPDAAERLVEAEAVDLLVLKPALIGGPTRALEIADLARAKSMEVVVTSALDSAVGRDGALHVACALGIRRACGLATGGLLSRDLGTAGEVDKGRLGIRDVPGIGVALE